MEFSQTYMQRERAARKAKIVNAIVGACGLFGMGALLAATVLIKVTQ